MPLFLFEGVAVSYSTGGSNARSMAIILLAFSALALIYGLMNRVVSGGKYSRAGNGLSQPWRRYDYCKFIKPEYANQRKKLEVRYENVSEVPGVDDSLEAREGDMEQPGTGGVGDVAKAQCHPGSLAMNMGERLPATDI
eukprot:g82872.t1